jgi:hypothetical protein
MSLHLRDHEIEFIEEEYGLGIHSGLDVDGIEKKAFVRELFSCFCAS